MNNLPCVSSFENPAYTEADRLDAIDDRAELKFYAMNMPKAYELLNDYFGNTGGDDIILGLAHWISCASDVKTASMNELADKIKEAVMPALVKEVNDEIESGGY